jgi:hypothetical protein
MRRTLTAAILFGFTATACGGDAQQNGASSPDDKKVAAADEGAAKDPGPGKIEGTPVDGAGGNPAVKQGEGAGEDRYTLQVEPPTEAKAGEAGVVTVKVLPKAPWHMNLDYPTKLTVEAPSGVELAKSEQKKADAKALTAETCEFDVAFTAADAGDKSFTGKFKFAICQDEACSPVQEDIEFQVAVK